MVFMGEFARRSSSLERLLTRWHCDRFKSIRFLLTDTQISRDTKTLVSNVARRKLQEPDLVNPILRSIQLISDEARRCLTDTEMSRSEQIATLEKLVDENHGHLVTLGVGHAALEAIVAKTGEKPWGLHTKLTGAGGGGCAVTIIPDGEFGRSPSRRAR